MLRWARAGHLPPILVRAGGAMVQPMPEGMMLGVEHDAEYEQRSLQLRSDDTLLFYTDGLIERRTASISDGLAEFAASVAPADPDLDAHVARILASAASDTGDDACLLAVASAWRCSRRRRHGPGPRGPRHVPPRGDPHALGVTK